MAENDDSNEEEQQTDPVLDPPKNRSSEKNSDGSTVDYKTEAEKWKALSRKNEADAKKLRAIEDAQKSELEKAQDRAAELEKRALAAERKAMRAEVGAEKKLPASLASRLQGDTLEEMMADADAILKDLGGSAGTNGQQEQEKKKNQENLQSLLVGGGSSEKNKLPDMNAFMRSQLPGASGS